MLLNLDGEIVGMIAQSFARDDTQNLRPDFCISDEGNDRNSFMKTGCDLYGSNRRDHNFGDFGEKESRWGFCAAGGS